MNKYSVLFTTIFLVVCAFTGELQAQAKGKIDLSRLEITGLTLSSRATSLLAGWPNELCSVDRRGRLRPAKGYLVRLDTRQKKVFLTADKDKRVLLPMDGDKDLGGNDFSLRWRLL